MMSADFFFFYSLCFRSHTGKMLRFGNRIFNTQNDKKDHCFTYTAKRNDILLLSIVYVLICNNITMRGGWFPQFTTPMTWKIYGQLWLLNFSFINLIYR